MEWSDSMLLLWRSDKDGVELMSDMASGDWLSSSSVNSEIDWSSFILSSSGLTADWSLDWLPPWPVLSESLFNIFLRYFALAFWNQTWKNILLIKMLFYLSHYYIDMFLSLHSKCMNMYISFIYCIAASMHECCLVSHWIKFWYEVNKKNHIYGISLRILASKDAISYQQF